MISSRFIAFAGPVVVVLMSASTTLAQTDYQYQYDDILVPAASADEPVAAAFSTDKAATYLQQSAAAWIGTRKCIACHTTGVHLVTRPALSASLGKPDDNLRQFALEQIIDLKMMRRETLLKGVNPVKVVYAAGGLAEWDAHITGQLSPETIDAFSFLFEIQLENGTWANTDCWPPYESDTYHVATAAAMALATAPGYLKNPPDEQAKTGISKLKKFLRSETPPHDYGKALLLWASTRMPDLIDATQKQELIEMLLSHQREDGGWSIRTFAAPESWGKGNRAEKLRSEPEFANPPSDGHQTGLAIIVLREAGLAADDPRIQKGIAWLLANQRESGRWWTRSLNTDKWHFITFSGTAYPLLALQMCDALPKVAAK
ncbi:hypothetical protein Mal52_41700 [Symmachiella dynata]|uniref:Squalene cyclase C-terminal domain-containing protein n=2 Tax=Symmachiella dynata TaxID=2527995 RepID=A0A517ZTB8_9PLAN|nr:hypothetical protein Mal52_41700 [Symmachiella dynata]